MTLRYAAALAFVGWYLLVPPLLRDGVDFNASLSEWGQREAFDTASACEQERSRLFDCGAILNDAKTGNVTEACGAPVKTRSAAKDKREETAIAQLAEQDMEGRCVEADDPRLK
jgi:hypothetical protein